MIFRRRRPDPTLVEVRRAFASVAEAVDAAQRALLAAVPTSRHPGAPLASALDEFDRRLEVVAHHIGQGRGTAEVWERCETAVVAARAEAEAMRASPPGPTEFEALNARLGDVLGPLEEFAEIERELRRL